MESNEGDGDGAGLVVGGGGADAAGPKRSSYEGAEGAADAEADLALPVQADPEGPEDRAADMGAAFPCGRRPKSRASRPWKSSMPGRRQADRRIWRSSARPRGPSTARRSARGERGWESEAARLGGSGQPRGVEVGGTGCEVAIGEMGAAAVRVAGDAAPPEMSQIGRAHV